MVSIQSIIPLTDTYVTSHNLKIQTKHLDMVKNKKNAKKKGGKGGIDDGRKPTQVRSQGNMYNEHIFTILCVFSTRKAILLADSFTRTFRPITLEKPKVCSVLVPYVRVLIS